MSSSARDEGRPAVVLLSGGLDSSTTLAVARSRGFRPIALSFEYGQRHAAELRAATAIGRHFGVSEHLTLTMDMGQIGGSALTDAAIAVPKDAHDGGRSIPITYVPARNTIFLSCALAVAESRGCADIFFGANAIDYSGYPDCRPEFLRAFESMAQLATRDGVEGNLQYAIHAPLLRLSKEQIVTLGAELGVPFELTHSCYDPVDGSDGGTLACGHCDSCLLRRAGFEAAGVADPVRYV